MPDSVRCRLHGGRAGRPRGTPQHPNTRAAAIEGRRRWVERMRLAKAQGLIEKMQRFPERGRSVALDLDLAVVLEKPDGVDTRDLLVHVLAATIEEPSWPALFVEMPATAFHRMR